MGVTLVTGATGFVGRHVFDGLRRRRNSVRPLVRDVEKYHALFGAHTRPLTGDLLQLRRGDLAEERVSSIVHCAAEVWPVDGGDASRFDANVVGTERLLGSVDAAHLDEVILISTFAVCGALTGVIDDTTPRRPASPYGASKAAQEEIVEDFAARHSLRCAIVRLPSVYGPGQHGGTVLPAFLAAARAHRPLLITGPPLRLQNFLYVADVTHAVDLCLEHSANGVFALGADRESTLRELADTVVRVTESRAGVGVHRRDADREPAALPFHIDARRAKDELGWRAEHDLESGLRAMLAAENEV